MPTAIISQPVSQGIQVGSLPTRLVTGWHLLSLDAPTVAVVWLLLLNRGISARELWVEGAALACAVWFIYVLDRFLDAQHEAGALQSRHYFVHRNRWYLLGASASVLPCFLVLIALLPTPVRIAWMYLGVPLALYASCVHFFRVRVPKELVVGVFFAAVVTTPSWTRTAGWSVVPEAAMFCVLCWWNCLSIARWELESPMPAAAGNRKHVLPALLTVTLLLCLTLPHSGPAVLAGAASGLLLWMLDRSRQTLDPLLLRSLADAALLTPLLVLAFLHSA